MLCAPQNRRFCPKPPASAPGDRLFCRYLPRKTLFFAPHSPGCTVFFPPRRGFPPGFPRQSRPNPRLFRPGFRRFAPVSPVARRPGVVFAPSSGFLVASVAFRPGTFRPGRRPRCSRKTPPRIPGFFRPRRGAPQGSPESPGAISKRPPPPLA